MNKIINETSAIKIIAIGYFLVFAFILSFVFIALIYSPETAVEYSTVGQFGDIIGGVVGSLWALAGVILFYNGLIEQRKDIRTNSESLRQQVDALTLQREEMSYIREEYKMAREVFVQQSDSLREQAKTSRIQQFEANFYSLLRIYIDIRNGIISGNSNFLERVNLELSSIKLDSSLSYQDKLSIINLEYQNIYLSNSDKISHYLKIIYRIYKTIDEQDDLNLQGKYFYAKVVRAQLIEDELFLINYNAHSEYGYNFRPLIKKYNVLKHLRLSSKVEVKALQQHTRNYDIALGKMILFLDDFISDTLPKLYTIDDNYMPFSKEIEWCAGINMLFILETTLEDDISFTIYLKSSSISASLIKLRVQTINYFLHYLYDRLYGSQFVKVENIDIIHVLHDSHDGKVKFLIDGSKALSIISDQC
ncbi:putative phage abortive infection protein [Aeromonas caviae]